MIPPRDRLTLCALALGLACVPARAAEVEADLACCRKPFVAGYRSCYDPCEPVGPVRRLFRAVFRVPCPPPAPPMMVPVAVVRPTADCAPSAVLPSAPPPAVDLGRPVPVNPPLDVPPPTPPAPVSGFGRRPPRLTPPTPPAPVPVRYDRMASRGGPGPEITLVHADRTALRVTATPDRDGSLTRDLEPGEWLVYTRGDDGRMTFRGKVTAREGVAVRVTLE
ncbi:MAG: hypothetical protein ACRC33_31820 [Gemmataceae bacterium]